MSNSHSHVLALILTKNKTKQKANVLIYSLLKQELLLIALNFSIITIYFIFYLQIPVLMLLFLLGDQRFCIMLGWKLLSHATNAVEWHSAVLHVRQRPSQHIMSLNALYLKLYGPQALPSYASWLCECYHSEVSNISLTWKTFWKRYVHNDVDC